MISRVEIRARIKAFALTAIAVFVVASLAWPLSVTNFRSVAGINLKHSASHSKAALEKILVEAVQHEASSERLEELITDLEFSKEIQTPSLRDRDFDAIRKSIQIGVLNEGGAFHLQVVIDGEGKADERELVNLLAMRVAERLSRTEMGGQLAGRFRQEQLDRYEQMDWLISQFETDLIQIKQLMGGTPNTNLAGRGNVPPQSSRFQLASDRRRTVLAETNANGLIDSVDVESLKVLLSTMKNQLADQKGEPDIDSEIAGLEIENLQTSKTLPIDGVPGLGMLVLLASFAMLVGSVVAWRFDPFETRGFVNAGEVAEKLQIPILATFGSGRFQGGERIDESGKANGSNWANRSVQVASMVLFGLLLIVIGFVMLNLEIREAFFENPFFGMAKIVRLFAGY